MASDLRDMRNDIAEYKRQLAEKDKQMSQKNKQVKMSVAKLSKHYSNTTKTVTEYKSLKMHEKMRTELGKKYKPLFENQVQKYRESKNVITPSSYDIRNHMNIVSNESHRLRKSAQTTPKPTTAEYRDSASLSYA